MTDGWLTALYSFLVHDLIVLVLLPVVLLRRKEPAATIAWIFAIVTMPIIGALAYLFFGNDRIKRRARRRGERKRRFRAVLPQVVTNLASPIDVKGQLQLYKLLERLNPYPPVVGNEVEILADMRRNYDLQLEAIGNAQREVHIEYYIFESDYVGEQFRDALIAAARRGVKVRFLYDAVGSLNLKRSWRREMIAAGIDTACFIPFSLLTRRWIYNFRNHRKILIVDGRVAFTGGANVGKEYLGESGVGSWADLQLRLVGPAVAQLQRVFGEDWAFASGHELPADELLPNIEPTGNVIVQVVPGGPDTKVPVYHELFFSAISTAVEQLQIVTPYFVPSEAILVALQTAARRGVRIQILVPGRSTHDFVHLAGQSYYQELLEAGIRLYEYQPGFMHSKLLTVDRRWSLVGTANLDNRSMRLNFEVGVVFYNVELTLKLDRLFDDYVKDSVRLDAATWRKRPLRRQVAENTARLFSSVL
jgi:cardiolipin synthase